MEDPFDEVAPPPSAGPARIEGAPGPLTPLVGRLEEAAEVAALVSHTRLLTVTGPGGGGKTRLALAAAEQWATAHPAVRVAWVSLATADGAALVAEQFAAAVGAGGRSPEEWAAGVVESGALLVLDNCEHLIDAVVDLVGRLLGAAADLHILVTSRAPLGVAGERRWPIPPLRTPGADERSDLLRYDAVRLFVDRARAVWPDFGGGVDNSDGGADRDDEWGARVAAICRRLDGNPLAIELCAARTQLLGLSQIGAALDDAGRLLVGRSRTAPLRHRSLWEALDWSHRLLSADEARLFATLGVFAGAADLETVCAANGSDCLDTLTALVESSLVRPTADLAGAAEGRRFELADPVRQYARLRLRRSGRDAEVRNRHLCWYARRAAAASRSAGSEQSMWYARLRADLPDLRAALAWAHESGQTWAGLRLAADLAPFAIAGGLRREGLAWLERSLADSLASPTVLGLDRPQDVPAAAGSSSAGSSSAGSSSAGSSSAALTSAALTSAALTSADPTSPDPTSTDRTSTDRTSTDPTSAVLVATAHPDLAQGSLLARARQGAGTLAFLQCDYAAAVRRLAEAETGFRQLADQVGRAQCLQALGSIARERGDYVAAVETLEQARACWTDAGDHEGAELAGIGLAFTLLLDGSIETARRLADEGLTSAYARGDPGRIADSLLVLGGAALADGDLDSAADAIEEALSRAVRGELAEARAYAVEWLAVVARERGQIASSAQLLAEALQRQYDLGDLWRTASVLVNVAVCELSLGQPKVASRALGVSAGVLDRIGAELPPVDRATRDRVRSELVRLLGDTALERGQRAGRREPLGEAVSALRDDLLSGADDLSSRLPQEGQSAARDCAPAAATVAPGATRSLAGLIDAGLIDAGLIDAGLIDAGLIDAGLIDAGPIERPRPARRPAANATGRSPAAWPSTCGHSAARTYDLPDSR